ncbi:cell number regulator 6, partial [Phtheirospermum japonicum]
MAEGTYVKLTKEQKPLQNITPGELNQPIDVAELNAPRCEQCGQTLPPTYSAPADEDWATGIFGCTEDHESCLTGLFCPCVLFGRNVATFNEDITEQSACVGHALCVEGGIALAVFTAAFNGIDPDTVCLLTEGLLFA